MERLQPPEEMIGLYPPILPIPSVARMKHSRDAIIAETQDWATHEARGRIKMEFELVGAIEGARSFVHRQDPTPPGYAVVVIDDVEHNPNDDAGLPDGKIVVKDDTARAVLELPRGNWLRRIEAARKKFGFPSLNVSALRKLRWTAKIAILNGYFQNREDRSTLIYHEEFTVMMEETM